MTDDGIEVVTATPQRWDDLVELFGTRGDASRCWCQCFVHYGSPEENKAALCERMQGQLPPGVLAYEAGQPVGWLRIGPLAEFPSVKRSRSYPQIAGQIGEDTGSVWQAACFVVKVGHRRHGVSAALLDGGLCLARAHGAATVIARPRDTAVGKTSSVDLYVGALSTFLKAGFAQVGRLGSGRVLVRLDLG